MSKVVHLSEEAHRRAKAYCQARNLRMSEWVAMLIAEATTAAEQAVTHGPTTAAVRASKHVRPAASARGADAWTRPAFAAPARAELNKLVPVAKRKLFVPVQPRAGSHDVAPAAAGVCRDRRARPSASAQAPQDAEALEGEGAPTPYARPPFWSRRGTELTPEPPEPS